MRLLMRLKRSVVTWPTLAGWGFALSVSVVTLMAVGLMAWAFGLLHWRLNLNHWPVRLVSVMVVPAFSEELVFRGMLIPARGESRHTARWIALGLLVFIVWHIIEAVTFLPGAHLFLRPQFLLCAAMLGAGCTMVRYHTGSLWPAVFLHGVTVFAWQVLFGGSGFADLMRI